MAGWSLATRVGACGAALAEDVYPRDGIAGFGGGLLCGALSTDTDVRRALSFRTGMAQYSQRRLRRPSGHIHHLTSEHGHLPKPILKDTAFMEWTFWDTLKRPNGTDLWVTYNPPKKFEIWYSPLNWDEVLDTGKHTWEYMGTGFWESE